MYKIIKNSSYKSEQELLLETEDLSEVISFFNRGDNVQIIEYEQMKREFIEYMEDNEEFNMSMQEYINTCLCSLGEVKATKLDMKQYMQGKLTIVRCINMSSGDSTAYICENTDIEIAYAIRFMTDIFGNETTCRGSKPTYELIIEEE